MSVAIFEGRACSVGATAPTASVDIAALIGQAAWRRLSPAIRRRFDHAAAVKPVTYPGQMRFDRSGIGLLFALASRLFGTPLPTQRADACPMTVSISGDTHGGVVWDRATRFTPDGPIHRITSTKRMGRSGHLLECVRGGLGMVLDVYEEDGALVFASRRYFLDLGIAKVPVPHLLSPGRCVVRHSDENAGHFRFTLTMRHAIWGVTFHQTGVFADPEAVP